MKNDKYKEFKFRFDINLKVIAEVTAKSPEEAKAIAEMMSIDEILKHEINDVSTIDIEDWE